MGDSYEKDAMTELNVCTLSGSRDDGGLIKMSTRYDTGGDGRVPKKQNQGLCPCGINSLTGDIGNINETTRGNQEIQYINGESALNIIVRRKQKSFLEYVWFKWDLKTGTNVTVRDVVLADMSVA